MKRNKKKIALLLLLFIFLGLVFPLKSALALDVVDTLSSALKLSLFASFFPVAGPVAALLSPSFITDPMVGFVAEGMARAIASWATMISGTILNLSYSLLGWVTGDGFINISMTGTDNVFVTTGWASMRNLANIILVLGVVVIGLGMILGIEEYKAKKTLPVLIAIAILINFTPVICGFFIDFSNILMKYFLTGGLNNGMTIAVEEGFSRMSTNNPAAALGISSVYFIFSLVASITLTLYAFLFAARYLFIWILVIFSPIAFASKVFPQSNKIKHFFPDFFYWDKWWDEFIRWCVIGIYAGFFIFLANQLMSGMVSSPPSGSLSIFGSLFGYFLPIVVLLIGYKSIKGTLEQEVPGAKEVMGLAQKAGMAAITGGAGLATGLAAGGAAGLYTGATAQTGKGLIAEAVGGAKGAARGAFTAGGREAGRKAIIKGAERIPFVGPKPGAYEANLRKETASEEDRLGKLNNEDLNYLAQDKTVLTREGNIRRAAALNILAKRGSLNTDNSQYLEQAQSFGLNVSEVLRHRPDMAARFNKDDKYAIEKSVSRQSPGDFAKNVQVEALQDMDVAASMDIKKIREIGAKGSSAQIKSLVNLANNSAAVTKKETDLMSEVLDAAAKGNKEAQDAAQERLDRFRTAFSEIKRNVNFKR
jgi:hypothetical protein